MNAMPTYRDGWMIDPAGFVAFKGPAIRIRPSWAAILEVIASADDCVTPDQVSPSAGYVHVQVCKLRRFLADKGLPDPIARIGNSRTGGGYVWRMPRPADLITIGFKPVHNREVTHA